MSAGNGAINGAPAGPVTIKVGGVAGQQLAAMDAIARHAGNEAVVVHGGGNLVGDWSQRMGIQSRFHDGLRITDEPTLDVVVAVLAGLVNSRIVAYLEAAGRPAIGLTGVDGGMLHIRPHPAGLGQVGEVVGIDHALLHRLLESRLTPVLAPIGSDNAGRLYNVNADEVAGAVAAARGGTLLLCTDVAAVLHDGQPVARLDPEQAEHLLDHGSATDGMRPKLRAAAAAARAGCTVRIIDGRSADAVTAALRGEAVGTTVTAAAAASQEVS
jgi:acetylglutamate kinase